MLDGFESFEFAHEGAAREVFRRGRGPGVVVMHEVPGITPEVAGFGRHVADAGFAVFLPHLFGTPGKPFSNAYALEQMLHCCVSREFAVLASRRSSPITIWLRALCRRVHAECGGPGVGAVGMCMTGNFALSLMVDEAVMAPVLSQPSLPLPITPSRRGAIHVSDTELAAVKRRTAAGCPVLGLRFSADPICPPARFATLRRELGAAFEGIEIDSGPGNPHGIPRSAHSVLTKDLVDEAGHPTRDARERVLAFLRERLTESAPR